MDPETLIFSFHKSRNNMEDSRDDKILRMAMEQVDKTLKDLGVRASEGYNVGYELGYIKGVLEHVLEAVPESQDKEAYMKGYVSGYVQGMLYTFARRHRDDKSELKFKSSF